MSNIETQSGGSLILIADDDPTMRGFLRESLEAEAFKVIEAVDGAQAVSLFTSQKPDLILLDVSMPGMDGFEACAAIRRLPGGDVTPILMLTGLDDYESVSKAYEAGATDFSVKPINVLVLIHRVRYMLRASRTLAKMLQSEERLAKAQRLARLGNWEWDLNSGELHWSEEMYHLFGIDPGNWAPTRDKQLERVHPSDKDTVSRALVEALRNVRPYSLDFRIVLPDGTERSVHEEAEVIFDKNRTAVRMLGATQDISDRKEVEGQIRLLAYYDGLTLLPNRRLFMEKLDLALENARRREGSLAVLFLDLDRFKQINDTLGHSAGDRLLQGVAERLRKCLRSSDAVARGEAMNLTDDVARLGGDEFIVSITNIARGEDAARVARRVQEALEPPFKLDENEVFVTASIGISLFPQDGDDLESLLKNADSAMYHAKDAGRSNYQFYSKSMNAAALQKLTLENKLRRALEREEFQLYFQPQIDVRSWSIIGAEALIRWRHPDLGLVPPAEFIGLAEETGLILPIGEWVLHTACAQAKAWQDAGHGPLVMAVNISGRQFRGKNLAQTIGQTIGACALDPRRIELEITESVLMHSVDETVNTLKTLRAMGPRIAVDDFGTGYSSLSYLRRFPIDTLKLDQSFIQDSVKDRGTAAIVAGVIDMAHGLGLEVIAEGVETAEQRTLLFQDGCHIMQGYLFGRPVPAPEFEQLLVTKSKGQSLPAQTGT
ncbi:MAG TPA: EAL domain-containing protein [Candidatus Dormibacteraeota bacterium]|nr:EAL domain-containing protein [Candidatus Dormibacteraeota bacterium]